jgi:hypothetical protein
VTSYQPHAHTRNVQNNIQGERRNAVVALLRGCRVRIEFCLLVFFFRSLVVSHPLHTHSLSTERKEQKKGEEHKKAAAAHSLEPGTRLHGKVGEQRRGERDEPPKYGRKAMQGGVHAFPSSSSTCAAATSHTPSTLVYMHHTRRNTRKTNLRTSTYIYPGITARTLPDTARQETLHNPPRTLSNT